VRRSWQDYLVKYLHKRDPDGNLIQYRNASPIWGCPSFDGDNWWRDVDPPTAANTLVVNKFNTGYGMHRYALAPYSQSYPPPAPPGVPSQSNGTAGQPGTGNVAIVRDGGSPNLAGSYFKMEKWGIRAADRGLLADSNYYDIIASTTWSASATVGPGTSDRRCDPFMTQNVGNPISGNSYISVDGVRHMPGGSSPKKIFAAKGLNMLFVDGHAAAITPEEAWIAIRGGGIDVRNPN
jgi:prepilin-type processing-associated H-X9-DG protein